MRSLALAALTTTVLMAGCRIEPNPPRRPVNAVGLGADVPLDLSRYRLVDLTHSFDASTVYWPKAPSGFRLDTLSRGMTEGGWFYAAESLSAPEHGGTHLDAPAHFYERGRGAGEVPLEQLIAPTVVIDISREAGQNPDYTLRVDDIRRFEREHGQIRRGEIVLLRTGWARFWPDRREYLGGDSAADLHFPSFGPDAAKLLLEERGVAALGADVASIDAGASHDFPVHRLLAERDVPALENLTNLAMLPPTGALLIALPMKISGGSGAPVRAIALVADRGR